MSGFSLLLIVLSITNGFESDTWREEIAKRLKFVEESNYLLRKENEHLKSIVLDVQRENSQLKEELVSVKDMVTALRTEDLNVHRKDIRPLPGRSEIFETSLNDTRKSVNNKLVSRIIPPETHPVSIVAFYAYLSTNSAPNLSVHHLIVYDVVHINRGNGYNKGDGIFIAPVTGVYALHFSVCIAKNRGFSWVPLQLTLNSNVLGATFEEGLDSNVGNHCSSGLAISDVNAGDHVFIRTQQATSGIIHSSSVGRTTFSGWLLYR
uniref:complement C1q-like protein 4 n=1 Tax=Saccostrea cuccullata TaxID=36930 RepID=UPI002ED55183